MGSFTGDYSRTYPGMYDEEKRYVGILPQQSSGSTKRPIVDADLLDHMLSQVHMLRLFISEVLGSGAPNDGFLVQQASSPSNNFNLKAGSFFNNGLRARFTSDIDYLSSGAHPNDIHPKSTGLTETVLSDSAANYDVNELVGRLLYPDASNLSKSYTITANTKNTITVNSSDTMVSDGATVGSYYIVGLSTPSANRIDTVYLDCYLDEWDKNEDSSLLHVINGATYETCNRLKIVQCVKVRENSTTIPTNGNDSDGNYHYYIKLAKLDRTATANITTSMITDLRLDIKRAIWQVPDLDVGGGYGDVTDGGLSIYQDGELKSDSLATFDLGLKLEGSGTEKIILDYDTDYSSGSHQSFLVWSDGTVLSKPQFGWDVSKFTLNKNLTMETVNLDGSTPTDTELILNCHPISGSGITSFLKLIGKDSSDNYGSISIFPNKIGEPNEAVYSILEQSGTFVNDPLHRFMSSSTITNLRVDGNFLAKKDIYLDCIDADIDTKIQFSNFGGSNEPMLKWDSSKKDFSFNYNIHLYADEGGNEIPFIELVASDTANKRAAYFQLKVKNATSDIFTHALKVGLDADSTVITDAKPNIANFLIQEGADQSNTPSFRFMSQRASATYNLDDFEVISFGDFVAYGDHLRVGHQWNTKASALSYISFFNDSTNLNGLIKFDGVNSRFEINEDIKIYKNRSGETVNLQIYSQIDKAAWLEIRAESGGASSAQNTFRIYANENVLLGANNDPNYVSFASRWSDANFGGQGANTKAYFKFEQRDNSDNVRSGMAEIVVDGDISTKSNGSTLTLSEDVITPKSYISFGTWDSAIGPRDASIYLLSNPTDFTGWLEIGNNYTDTKDCGLKLNGYIIMTDLTGMPTHTPSIPNGSIWIYNGNLYFRSGGTTYVCTATTVP